MRWRARTGFTPSDTTIKYAIFKQPYMDVNKVTPAADDAVSAGASREALLEAIAAKRELLRRHYRMDLFDFTREVMGYDKLERKVHGELCQRLMDAYYGRGDYRTDENSVRRYLFLLPRGTFKTTIATISYPIWVLLQDDPIPLGDTEFRGWRAPDSFNTRRGHDQRLLIASEVEGNATRFHQNIKEQFQGNERIKELYGALAPEKRVDGLWTKTQSNVTWRMDFRHKEANITTTSLDATVNSGHYDIAVCDDMISEKQVSNDEQIQQTIEWYRRLLPLMEKPSVVIFIGTRWHDKDLYGHFIDDERSKWEVYRESAERSDDEVEAGARRYFFPNLLGKEVLEDLRTSMRPYLFSCQYYNEPVASRDALFKQEYFTNTYFHMPAGESLTAWLDSLTIITTIDPAISKEKRGCYAVIITMGWDHKGRGWVLDLFREQGVHPHKLLDVAFEHHAKWDPISIGIEQEGFQKMYKFEADRRSQETKVWPNWVELKPGGRKKTMRIAGLEPLFRGDRIRLQHNMGHNAIEEEAIRFPRGRYRDGLDAMAYQLDLAFAGKDTSTAKVSPTSDVESFHQKRLERLRINTYSGVEDKDWYNM